MLQLFYLFFYLTRKFLEMETSFPRETWPRQHTTNSLNRKKTQQAENRIIKHTMKILNPAQITELHFSVTWTFIMDLHFSKGTRLLKRSILCISFQVQGAKQDKVFSPAQCKPLEPAGKEASWWNEADDCWRSASGDYTYKMKLSMQHATIS